MMSTFLNFDLEGKINSKFFFKHILFSIYWIVGILLFIFRIDVVLIDKYASSLGWLKMAIPTVYFICLFASLWLMKWYYILVFLFYPFLLIAWFIPKAILSKGKIYLLG